MLIVCHRCFRRLSSARRPTVGAHLARRLLSVLFYGSDDFSVVSLETIHRKLLSETASSLELVTGSERNAVSQYARAHQLVCHQFPYRPVSGRHDIGVVVSFGRLIPEYAINACRMGVVNVHGSLLPRWRGAAPLNHALLHGDSVTGVTIMKIMPKRFDVGHIVAQRQHPIAARCTVGQLRRELGIVGAQLLFECLSDIETYLKNSRPQPEDGITYAPKFDESYGELDWRSMTAEQIDRRFRAFYGCIDIYSYWTDGTLLKLHDIVDPQLVATLELNRLSNCSHPEPGLVYYHKKRRIICVASAGNTWSAFGRFTLAGRRRMTALQIYNGFINQKDKCTIIGRNDRSV